ncbi:PTS sugar transporter subunit IIA [Metabacillus sp. Hm71]|uniref:PTS sugar transporter subunit IIA n=1 Tax=Metabacillus sp. Hm71 TaxID=3450743 RepID=UPI003F423F50
MNTLFQTDNIRTNVNLHSKKDVFKLIAEIAVSNNISSAKQSIIDGLSKREQEGTTGFMDGFAIPHTKSKAIDKAAVIIVTLSNGVEWESMDNKPIRFAISLLIPESEAGTTHLSLLSSISRMLIHEDIRQNLLNATNPNEIIEVLNNAMVNQ